MTADAFRLVSFTVATRVIYWFDTEPRKRHGRGGDPERVSKTVLRLLRHFHNFRSHASSSGNISGLVRAESLATLFFGSPPDFLRPPCPCSGFDKLLDPSQYFFGSTTFQKHEERCLYKLCHFTLCQNKNHHRLLITNISTRVKSSFYKRLSGFSPRAVCVVLADYSRATTSSPYAWPSVVMVTSS